MIIDTNALSAWADGRASCRAALASSSRLVVPVVVLGEYRFGIAQSRHRPRYEEWLDRYLPLVEMAPVSPDLAVPYAEIRDHLKRRGTPIPSNDVWIAAVVRRWGLPLLSNDAHFDLVPGVDRVRF